MSSNAATERSLLLWHVVFARSARIPSQRGSAVGTEWAPAAVPAWVHICAHHGRPAALAGILGAGMRSSAVLGGDGRKVAIVH